MPAVFFALETDIKRHRYKKPLLEKAIIRKGRATTNFFAEFSLINVYPPNFNPRKIVVVYHITSFLSHTKWSDTPISTGCRRPGWYPRVSFRTIVHHSSIFRQTKTAALSFFVQFQPVVNIASSPTYTAIALSNNELDLREHDRSHSLDSQCFFGCCPWATCPRIRFFDLAPILGPVLAARCGKVS